MNRHNQDKIQSGFIGAILVNRQTQRAMRITTKSVFFRDELIVKVEQNKIVFRKPPISYVGKVLRPTFYKKTGFFAFCVVAEIPEGRYEFDEDESNEDRIVAYFKNAPDKE